MHAIAACEGYAPKMREFRSKLREVESITMKQLETFQTKRPFTEIEALLEELDAAAVQVSDSQESMLWKARELNSEEARINQCCAKRAVYETVEMEENELSVSPSGVNAAPDTALGGTLEPSHMVPLSINNSIDSPTLPLRLKTSVGHDPRKLNMVGTLERDWVVRATGMLTHLRRELELQQDELSTNVSIIGFTISRHPSDSTFADGERLRKFARQAMDDAAATTRADVLTQLKSELDARRRNRDGKRKVLHNAVRRYEEAKTLLHMLREQADSISGEYGGLSLRFIADLREHQQHIHALISPGGALTAFKGHLHTLEKASDKMRVVLECNTDDGALEATKCAVPWVIQASDECAYLVRAFSHLRDRFDAKVAWVRLFEQQAGTPALQSAVNVQAASQPKDGDYVLAHCKEEDEEMW